MRTIHALLLNLLIGLNVFIVFFLLFESRIVVPPALQVLGRGHPLFLHFPIVLLVLAWGLSWFGDRLGIPQNAAKRFIYVLLFASAWSAAITVVAGLLLAKEGGYEGSGFLWHKWMGVVLCFLANGLLWYHRWSTERAGRHHRFFLAGLSLSLVVLLVAGHQGAGLTHGDDFLFEPLRDNRQKTLDMATAVVYQDLVYPILEEKCLSCHSTNKAKGDLVLADTASLMKGGENGPVLVKGSVGESLMMQRLLLELDHEHRMPPKGKPQLTSEELALIDAWIASGADFNIPLAELPPNDTIRYLAATLYDAAEETFDFAAADAGIIEKLNSPYRVVKPLAQTSPALAVGYFGKAFYNDRSLRELEPINQQVVSLTLSGMPLTGGDRDVLGAFANLRELMLNGTPVDDSWSEVLSQLSKLQSVSLSSTDITEAGLTKVLSAPALRTVYVWNTGIDGAALERLQQQYKHVRIERGYVDDGSTVLPLNDPIITPVSKFFNDKIQVTLDHPVTGVELRYTLDGAEPDSVHSMIYKAPFDVAASTVVRVKGYKAGWLASREIKRAFHRSAHSPAKVVLLSQPDPRYKGRGAYSLYDLESGSNNHADGKWLGSHGRPIIASMHFDTGIGVDTIGIDIKQDYGSHIYPPEWVEVWGGADSVSAQLLSRFRPELHKPEQVSPTRLVNVPVGGKNIRYLRLTVEPYIPIPAGYPANGNPAWIFADEITVR